MQKRRVTEDDITKLRSMYATLLRLSRSQQNTKVAGASSSITPDGATYIPEATGETLDIEIDRVLLVKITAAADGGGKYIGRELYGFSTANIEDDIELPEDLTEAAADNVLVINIAEDGTAGHVLPIPTYALGLRSGMEGDKWRCFIDKSPPGLFKFKLGDPAGGAGKYFGYSITGNTTVDPDEDLTDADFGSIAGEADCLCINSRESGKDTHDLDTDATFMPQIFFGTVVGRTDEGLPVVAFDGYQWEDCTLPGGGGGE